MPNVPWGEKIIPFEAHFTDEGSEAFPLDLSFPGQPNSLPEDQAPLGYVET